MSWQDFAERPDSEKIYTAEISVADPENPTAERETLYFSTTGLNPALATIYHEPCIAKLPTFKRTLQALTSGATAAAFGSMTLLIGDGHLDESIAAKLFAGSPVVIKSGFEELPLAEFKEIFTGRISGEPKWTDSQMVLPLADSVRDLLDKKMFSMTEVSGQLPVVIKQLLGMAGYSAGQINSQLWDAWAADNDFTVWLPISAGQSIGAALYQLLPPLGCWFGLDSTGLFAIGTYPTPAEIPDVALFRSVTLSYYTATGDNADTSTLVWDNTSMTPEEYESGVDSSQTTYLSSQDDAETVLNRWADLKFTPLYPVGYTQVSPGSSFDELGGSLSGIVSYLLDLVDITEEKRDSEMWNTWAAENDFEVWTKISAAQSVSSVLDLLLSPLGCWYGFSRDGQFRVATFGAPAENATPVAELTDIEMLKFGGEKNHGNHAWKVVVSYYSTTGSMAETSDKSWEDESVKTLNPAAKEITKNSSLTNAADAEVIRDRWKSVLATRRLVASVTAKVQLFAVQLGNVVRINRDRFGMDALYTVQESTDNLSGNKVSLELFR